MEKIITLKKNEEHRILAGHLWAFSNEIRRIDGSPQAGDVVELRDHAGSFLGKGFYNPHSLIAVRLLTRRQDEEADADLFRNRIGASLRLRRLLYPGEETFRIVHGESDFLPGLIIDKFNDLIAVQTLSYGMESRMSVICDILESLLQPRAVIERNETLFRQFEGLEQKKGLLRGSEHRTAIVEHGITYELDLLDGQKTGFFLDQRENRKAFRRYAGERRVLDCFCNSGGFALNGASAGASETVGIDVSEAAVGAASHNAEANGLGDRVRFTCADAFEYLRSAAEKGEKFDVINLDPPSFAKTKKTVLTAKRGYAELHALAFAALGPEGILATSSCSHHIFEETFLDIINVSARQAGREISILEWRGAAPDHPVLPAMPETKYLKFGVFRVS